MSNDPRLKLLEKIRLQLTGNIYVGDKQLDGWTEPLPHYIFKCPIHGIVSSYPAGHDETLMCPLCLEEEARRTANDTVDTTTSVTAD